MGLYETQNITTRTNLVRSFLCPSDPGPNRGPSGVAMTNYAGSHNDVEAPIAAKNNGVFFLNSAIRYEDITDGTSQTIFVGEKLNDGLGEGWASGTRASLRNIGIGGQRGEGGDVRGHTHARVPDGDDGDSGGAGQGTAGTAFDTLSFVGGYQQPASRRRQFRLRRRLGPVPQELDQSRDLPAGWRTAPTARSSAPIHSDQKASRSMDAAGPSR